MELQAYQRYSVPGLYCIDLERRLRREGRSARRDFSNAAEPIFATGTGRSLEKKEGRTFYGAMVGSRGEGD
ncbi:hypothetical protein EPO44_01075 [bacterium]|nr:MAG: hypothetical protein EPO44_01075 [bacterium]